MKLTELDNMINEVLAEEAKKLIKEGLDINGNGLEHEGSEIKDYRSLLKLKDKITNIQTGNRGDAIITIDRISEDELKACCGGETIGEAGRNLMQSIHHEMKDIGGYSDGYDVTFWPQPRKDGTLKITIEIMENEEYSNPNSLSNENDMKEQTKDTNPTAKDDKDVILGSKEVGEQTGALTSAFLAPVVAKAGQVVADKVADKLGVNSEEVDEEKKWIQKAIKPSHEGYCTPMTKPTCTPKRKALAKTLKKMAKNESTQKKTITLSEAQMTELLKKIISEAATPAMDPKTEDVLKKDGKQNSDALKAVEKKIKDYLSFKGNDNPEFPNQIGMGDEKAARVATSQEEEEIDDNRGRGPQDLDYQNEPSDKFKERVKMSLVGSSEMGNPADAANAIKTDVGKNMHKSIERRQKIHRKEPIYAKEAVPVDKKKPEDLRPVVNEEIIRMKQMASYNEKTQ